MASFENIKQALKILDLPERAYLNQIDEHFRELIHKWHLDKCREKVDLSLYKGLRFKICLI